MPEFKFYYFQLHGRACAARALLAHSKTDYENIEIGFPEWPELKPTMPNQQVPCLELPDGTKMGQSIAITRYLGQVKGYYPKDSMQAYKVDSLIDRYMDVITVYKPHFMKDGPEKDALIKKGFEETIPKWLAEMEIVASEGKFLVGDSLTIADFFIGSFYTDFVLNEHMTFGRDQWVTCLDNYPNFKAYCERYAAENKDYLEKRN